VIGYPFTGKYFFLDLWLPKKASSVYATPEVAEFISKLPKGGELWNLCRKALVALSDNIFAGAQVEKSKIPKYYVEKYAVTNISVFRLDASRRLIYTWVGDSKGGIGEYAGDILGL